ncbi:MAG: biopolymer transport protein ExbB [Gammaproteobacteria bacterium]|nr:MAG: biopolymer transport protein ExbB [Gammaproteobacteria bacterium]
MLELIESGGWLMVPIILCSIIALAIIVERFWALQRSRICPRNLVNQIWQWARGGGGWSICVMTALS